MTGPTLPSDVWASFIEALRDEVSREKYERWFRRMRLRDLSGGRATLAVPNAFLQEWIETYYGDLVRRILREVTGQEVELRVVADADLDRSAPADAVPHDAGRAAPAGRTLAGPGSQRPAPGVPRGADATFPPEPRPRTSIRRVPGERRRDGRMPGQLFGHPRYPNFLSDVILNEDYLLEQFVEGPSNQLALAAAQAVANAPGQAYNPLFLHGLVGLGKTHLLQGICQRVLARRPDMRVLYLSCESFVNHFISAVEAGELEDFRYRYRHVDLLLIDDIHFLARKERTQEEFFHTFNTLYNSRKQIVLSCDSPPREIPTIEDRLVSRFKWGLVAEIEPPDHETRIRIVRRKAEQRGHALPSGVGELIADSIATNVREIEGAVLKVIGYASLTKKPLTLELAEEALRDVLTQRERKVSLDTILRAVCEHFAVKPSDLVGKRRHKSVSHPRQICMYLARRMTELSLVEIGGQMGGRDHTTVIYAVDRVANEIETSPRLREDVEAIARAIRSGG